MFLTDHYEMAAGVLVSVLLQVRNLGSWCAMSLVNSTRGWLKCCSEFTVQDAAEVFQDDLEDAKALFGCKSDRKPINRMPESEKPVSQQRSRSLLVENVQVQKARR